MTLSIHLVQLIQKHKDGHLKEDELLSKIVYAVSKAAHLKIQELEKTDAYQNGISISDLFQSDVLCPLEFFLDA